MGNLEAIAWTAVGAWIGYQLVKNYKTKGSLI